MSGAWWDRVDEIAVHVFGHLLSRFPGETWPWLDAWIDGEDLWLRRTALLAQNQLKEGADLDRLFAYCRKCMNEREFFIRKA